jgi:hypothetical protein
LFVGYKINQQKGRGKERSKGEITFIKITTNSLLGLMQRIKSERKLQLLLPPQTNTNIQGSHVNKINEISKINLNILIKIKSIKLQIKYKGMFFKIRLKNQT